MRAPLRWALIGLLAAALMLPFAAFALNAFALRWFYPQLLPTEWSAQAWARLFAARSNVPLALWNSTRIAALTAALALLVGYPAGRALGLHRFPGKRAVELVLLAPAVVPVLAAALGLAVNFLRWGWAGTVWGVALVHTLVALPYVIFTLSGVFAAYDTALEQQARTLGANAWQVLWRVTRPALTPALGVAWLFAFLASWGQYLLTFLIGGGRVPTLPLLLFSAAPGGDNAATAVLALLTVAPATLALLVSSRALASGAAGGLGRL